MAHCVLLVVFGAQPHKTARRMVHEFRWKTDTNTNTHTHTHRHKRSSVHFTTQDATTSPSASSSNASHSHGGNMTTHLPPVPRSRISGAIPLLPHVHGTGELLNTQDLCLLPYWVPFTVLKYPEMNTITVSLWTVSHWMCILCGNEKRCCWGNAGIPARKSGVHAMAVRKCQVGSLEVIPLLLERPTATMASNGK
jgi:hypothetical protein